MPVWLREWWPVLAVLINVVAAWIIWSARQQFMTRKACAECSGKLAERVDALERQRTCVDIKLDQLPQVESMHEMALRQEMLAGKIEALEATIEGLRDLITRIERPLHLMLEGHLNGPRRGTG